MPLFLLTAVACRCRCSKFCEIIKWKYEAHGQLIQNVIIDESLACLILTNIFIRTHRKNRCTKFQLFFRQMSLFKNVTHEKKMSPYENIYFWSKRGKLSFFFGISVVRKKNEKYFRQLGQIWKDIEESKNFSKCTKVLEM